jgi:hypothetical protein
VPPDTGGVGPNNGGGGGGRTGRCTEVGEGLDATGVELDIVFDPSPIAIVVVTFAICFNAGFDNGPEMGELEIGELDKPDAPNPLASLRMEGTGEARASLPDKEWETWC